MKLSGLVFRRDHAGIRLYDTKRVDLAVDRFRLRNSADIAAIEIGDPGRGRLRRVLEQKFTLPGSGGTFTNEAVDLAINACRRLWAMPCHHRDDIRKPEPIVAWHQPIIQRRRVEDPYMTRSEMLQQLKVHPDARWIGYQRSDVNMSELIGGFARVKKRTEAQTQAAAEFRNLAERAMLGGSKAVDLSAIRVDTSADASNPIMVIGAEARARLQDARNRLGDLATVAERIIVGGESISELTVSIGWGSGARARDRVTKMLLKATDELALEFGFVARGKANGNYQRRRATNRVHSRWHQNGDSDQAVIGYRIRLDGGAEISQIRVSPKL
jgi:hypothetical protein